MHFLHFEEEQTICDFSRQMVFGSVAACVAEAEIGFRMHRRACIRSKRTTSEWYLIVERY